MKTIAGKLVAFGISVGNVRKERELCKFSKALSRPMLHGAQEMAYGRGTPTPLRKKKHSIGITSAICITLILCLRAECLLTCVK